MKKRYQYGWKVYVNYGFGWEWEVFEHSRREILARVREYRANCQYAVKFGRGRVEIND